MRERNPYKVLRVPRDADDAAIEDAYDRLFDEYEPRAHADDAEARRMLDELNKAHDVLLDPEQRADVDARLSTSSPARATSQRSSTATMPRSAPPTTARSRQQTASNSRASAQRGRSGSGARPRSVAPRTTRSPVPFVIGGVALLVVVAVAVFFIARNANGGAAGSGGSANRGAVVATINDQSIYEQDLNNRYEKDKTQQTSDPLIGSILAEGGITSTRVLDVIKQDALDKLINMEIIQQQARKETLYPDTKTQNDLITQAKQTDVKPGQSFEDSLKEHSLTEDQYTRNVITTAVYRVMASKYMPAKGSASERQTAFIKWICDTRQSYDVKVLLTFSTSNENKPCSSGLPSDIDLTGGQLAPPPPAVPSAQPSVAAPVAPRTTP